VGGTLLGPEGTSIPPRWPLRGLGWGVRVVSGAGASASSIPRSGCPWWGGVAVGGRVGGGVRVVFENFIVDASMFFVVRFVVRVCMSPARSLLVGGCGGVVCVFVRCGQVGKGARWMPRHQEPMKDVGGCVKPRGAANRALIRGCPNGGTRHPSWGVTRA
jgi:hypothetical protein